MNNKDFIAKYADYDDGKSRHYGNLITDGKGDFWSYGDHYPLRINLGGGLFLLNREGYSVTTSRHIGIASSYCQCSIDSMPEMSIRNINHATIRAILTMSLKKRNAILQRDLKGFKPNWTRKIADVHRELFNNMKTLELIKSYKLPKNEL